MKKLFSTLLAVLLIAALVIGCAPAQKSDDDTSKWAINEDLSGLKAITIGLATDVGGIDDKSFNQGTWEGILNYANNAKLEESNYRYVQSNTDADYIPNLSLLADEKLDLIIAPGFLFKDSMTEAAASYPDQKFVIIDTVVDKPNVASAVFAEHEGSFLVGVAAALKAKEAGKDTVGFLGGMDFPLIQKFEAGFEQGVAAVDPNMKVLGG